MITIILIIPQPTSESAHPLNDYYENQICKRPVKINGNRYICEKFKIHMHMTKVGLFGIGLDTYWGQFEGLLNNLKK